MTNHWYAGYLLQSGVETLRITYADLTKNTDNVLETIAAFLGIDDAYLDDPNSHTLGGNPAVSSIISKHDEKFDAEWRADYLDGKYAHKSDGLQVAYDDSWKDLPAEFAAEASEAMRDRLRDVSPLMQLLGHAPLQGDI
jgi:hypothetical protein